MLSAEKDTTIECKEGTRVTLQGGSFVSAVTGEQVMGDVEVQVREYYRTSDILLANLTTTSGDEILETGGMVYIEATHDGEECTLSESATIELSFPYEREKEGMQLFTGAWNADQIEWTPVKGNTATVTEQDFRASRV